MIATTSQFVRDTQMATLPDAAVPGCPAVKILKGQRALVTGASNGISKAIAIALGEAGADVVVNYRSGDDAAREVVERASQCGSKCYAHKADVSNEAEVKEMFTKMLKDFGTIDILVSNAGLQRDAKCEETTLDQWNTVRTSLTGQFLCSREAVKEFKRRGVRREISCSAGKIICISSGREVIPWAGHVNYAALKGGVVLMMKSIAQEVASSRIRVLGLCVGAVPTPIRTNAWKTAKTYKEFVKPLGRIGESDTIDQAAMWLASDYTDYITGLIPRKCIGEPDGIGQAAVWLASDYADYVTSMNLHIVGDTILGPRFEAGG
jgi:glucose 1-dehydrogenase